MPNADDRADAERTGSRVERSTEHPLVRRAKHSALLFHVVGRLLKGAITRELLRRMEVQRHA